MTRRTPSLLVLSAALGAWSLARIAVSPGRPRLARAQRGLFLAALAGCAPVKAGGDCFSSAYPYFPNDLTRVSTFVNAAVDWELRIEKETDDDGVVTFGWTRMDTEEWLGAVAWSADAEQGVQVHGWQDGDGAFTWPCTRAKNRDNHARRKMRAHVPHPSRRRSPANNV